MLHFLRRVGLPRLLRLGLTLTIPPLWYEIMLLHYRGSFQSRFMWLPILSLPAVTVAGVASNLRKDEDRSRDILHPFAWFLTVLGVVGTIFHLRGVGRQMGGFYNWKYNVVTGPPFPAPMQVGLWGLLGVIASRRASGNLIGSHNNDERKIVRSVRWINSLSYVLVGIESGYYHWSGNFSNRLMYIPILINPVMASIHLLALFRSRLARLLELPFSLFSALVGLIGFGFHIRNLLNRPGRVTWQNLFYGPPLTAPLQMTAYGTLGTLLSLFSEES